MELLWKNVCITDINYTTGNSRTANLVDDSTYYLTVLLVVRTYETPRIAITSNTSN